MLDECSLTSAELLSKFYSALHFAKEKPDQWFGGAMVIFAGNLYQFPPVGTTALYTLISAYDGGSSEATAKHLS